MLTTRHLVKPVMTKSGASPYQVRLDADLVPRIRQLAQKQVRPIQTQVNLLLRLALARVRAK